MNRRIVFLALACSSLAFAPAPFRGADNNKSQMQKLQGTWAPVTLTLESGGIPVQLPWDKMEIAENRMRYFRNGNLVSEWIISLDARKRPKVLDSRVSGGSPASPMYKGVYQLQGDKLTICSSQRDRPASLNSGKTGQMFEVFQRSKP